MGAFDPMEPEGAKPRTKSRPARKSESLAERMSTYIGCDKSDTSPPDTARRYKEYLRASLDQKLIVVAEWTGIMQIATMDDTDFSIHRTKSGKHFTNLF